MAIESDGNYKRSSFVELLERVADGVHVSIVNKRDDEPEPRPRRGERAEGADANDRSRKRDRERRD